MSHYDAMDASDEGQIKSSGEDFVMSGDDEEHDADSLDIKPPQAARDISSSRRKEKSSHKEKKRAREKRHKERHSSGGGGSERERDRGSDRERERERERMRERKSGGVIETTDRESLRERRSNPERQHFHSHSRSYERGSGDDVGGGGNGGIAPSASMLTNNDRRYQKHYDSAGSGSNNYHHHHHHHQHYVQQQYHSYQAHMQRQRQDYYERAAQPLQPNYQQNAVGAAAEYHHHHSGGSASRHHQSSYAKHSHNNDHTEYDVYDEQRERERRKLAYDQQQQPQPAQKDAESLEQDLRSRLLSKRHKYVKSGDDDDLYEATARSERKEAKRSRLEEKYANAVLSGSDRSDREHSKAEKHQHHQQKREKMRDSVIEVLDSPPPEPTQTTRRKHKKHSKEMPAATVTPLPTVAMPANTAPVANNNSVVNVAEASKRKTPDDPELLARRAKFLAAEREKEQRKESAREELEARREKRRERKDAGIIDILSPSAVAASVTAGLNVVRHKKRSNKSTHKKHHKHKKAEHSGDDEDDDNDDDDDDDDSDGEIDDDNDEDDSSSSDSSEASDDDDDDDDSETESDSNSETEIRRASSKRSSKTVKTHAVDDDDDDDDDLQVIKDSPLSLGELEKSPTAHKRKSKRHKKHKRRNNKSLDADADIKSDRSRTPPSHSRSRSNSAQRRRQHSRSNTASRSLTRSRSPDSLRRSLSHSSRRHRTRSRSLSHSSRSVSRTRSESRSHSPSRSRSSSRTRSEERGMKAFQQQNVDEIAAVAAAAVHNSDAAEHLKRKSLTKNGTVTGAAAAAAADEEQQLLCDETGIQLPNYYPGVQGCRSVEEFQCLNRIEEGTYGVVYRAKDKRTNEIVALKRLKMEKEKEGFPITSLREINTLLKGQHPNIVTVREIVVGSNMDKIFIVMDYVEHDLKSLMETMKNRKQSFFPGEVKCLTQQLLRAVSHLHDNWILHRDLKTSNLLLSHKGILKVGDFGLAREYGSPLKKYTSLVVTLWYRAPELLLCAPEYSTPIDIWSVGCIFAEFLQMSPLFPGKAEIDQLNKIFKELGTPNEKIWPGYSDLPAVKNVLSKNPQFTDYPVSNLRKRFMEKTTDTGIALLQGLLTYDPKQRLNADAALKHPYFRELPLPIDPSMFPTWPAKSELGARKALASSPKPPSGGSQFKQLGRDELVVGGGGGGNGASAQAGSYNVTAIGGKMVSGIITGNKKSAANTGFVLNAGIDQRQLAMGPGFSLKF